MEKEQEQKVSKYNSGISALIRVNDLWIDTHKHSRAGLFSLWNTDLDRVWCELSRNLDETKFNTAKKIFDAFETSLMAIGNIIDSKPSGFKDLSEAQISNRDKHYKILMEKELFLRRLENELGLGNAWEDEEGDDFD